MEISEILEAFRYARGYFPEEALAEARERREEIKPYLLEILDRTVRNAKEVAKEEDVPLAHIFAMFLLAEFREERAYPSIVALSSLPSDLVDALLCDISGDGLDRVLASVCGGDIEPILRLIQNPMANEWVRGAGVRSMLCLMAAGLKTREEVIEIYRGLYSEDLGEAGSHAWNELVACSMDLYPEELMPEIQKAYSREMVDERFVAFCEAESELEKGREVALGELRSIELYGLVRSVEEEMEAWACFTEDTLDESDWLDDDLENIDDREFLPETSEWLAPETVRRDAPKVGRNEPCPCGSGRKYKKCCGA